ncbi:(2Fe-2S)-binding protein [Brevibacillus sp. TJ4]|uniref:(2Fe-2S)-binding protein n=1 Tax=Brevibacillus sp. TJ4 TaxID=3234853 RepID=UPI003B9F616B
MSTHTIKVEINGRQHERTVSSRMTLVDFLRDELDLTGTHIGCEHGVCGTCTILMDGEVVRSCIMLAVQADGHRLETVEGLASQSFEGEVKVALSPIQEAFRECHGLQCGYCTPGMLMTTKSLLEENPNPTEEEIRLALSGNICRCTGYVQIVDAVKLAAQKLQEG